jgi:hypothetical protein
MFLLLWKSETGQESPNDILQGGFFVSVYAIAIYCK